MLEAREVSVRFGGHMAVSQVNLDVERGEIAGLIGPNGAGKTTLFNAVTGFVPIESGRVTFFGEDVSHDPAYRRAQLGMGRTFQTERPFEELTVLENVLVAAFLRKARRAEAEQLAREMLERVGLADRADQPALDLNLARRRIEMGGNIGRPVMELEPMQPDGFYALELCFPVVCREQSLGGKSHDGSLQLPMLGPAAGIQTHRFCVPEHQEGQHEGDDQTENGAWIQLHCVPLVAS